MFESVGGNEGLCRGGEALDDEGPDGDLDGVPGQGRIGVLSLGSAALVDEVSCSNHFGEALTVFQEAVNEVGG